MTINVGAIFLLFLEQEIIMFLEVGLEPTVGLIIGLMVEHIEVGDLIHTIMIPLHREGRIMMVGIAFQIEVGIIADFKEAEVVMA